MRERLSIVALAAFVIVDLVLVSLAFRHTSQSPPAASAEQARHTSAANGAGSGASAPGGPSPSAPTSDVAQVTGRAADPMLAVTEDGTLLRATRGSCRDQVAPTVEVSGPGPLRLHRSDVEGLTQVLAVEAVDGLRMTGLDSGCALTTYTSDDDGETWTAAEGAAGSWHLSPRPRRPLVTSPDGQHQTPCPPRDLASVDGGVARLLCPNGLVKGTSDAGASWITLGQLVGAVDLAYQGPGDGAAVARREGCDAALMRTVDGGSSWSEASCLTGGDPRAVAVAGDTVLAQAGDRLQVSTDAGQTWQRVRG